MSAKVFGFKTYLPLLKAYLTGDGNRGRLSRAGEALNVQRSYFSRVLSGELQLTPDHAFRLSEFLGFNESERDYFLALVETERASTPSYREFQKRRAELLRKKFESLDERTNRKALAAPQNDIEYFSAWYWSAIHFLTSTVDGQTVDALSQRLNLSPKVVREVLQGLKTRGYASSRGERWLYAAGEFHTPKGDPLTVIHHQNWRTRAVQDAQLNSDESIHFTAVQSVSRGDVEKLRELLLSFIGDASRIAGPSNPEETIALTCDLFRV